MKKFPRVFVILLSLLSVTGAYAASGTPVRPALNPVTLQGYLKTPVAMSRPVQSGMCAYESGVDCERHCDQGLCVKCRDGGYACIKMDPPPTH